MQNIQQLVAGDYDVAFSLADTAADAVNGDGDFDGAQDVSTLGRIYSNYTQVVVRTDAGIESVEDFEGKSDLHRLAAVRHRGHRQPADRGVRARGRPTSRRSASTSPRPSTA